MHRCLGTQPGGRALASRRSVASAACCSTASFAGAPCAAAGCPAYLRHHRPFDRRHCRRTRPSTSWCCRRSLRAGPALRRRGGGRSRSVRGAPSTRHWPAATATPTAGRRSTPGSIATTIQRRLSAGAERKRVPRLWRGRVSSAPRPRHSRDDGRDAARRPGWFNRPKGRTGSSPRAGLSPTPAPLLPWARRCSVRSSAYPPE